MRDSCAPYPQIAMSFVQIALFVDTSKIESQQYEELQIRTLQWATPCSSSASMSLEQSRNTYPLFSIETKTVASLHLAR